MIHDRWFAGALVALSLLPAPGCKGLFRRSEDKPAAAAPVSPAPGQPRPTSGAVSASVPPGGGPTSAPASTPAVDVQTVRIQVPDMEDQCCAEKVETILAGVPGVSSARVDMATKVATVSYRAAKTRPERLVEVLRQADWQASLAGDGK